MSEDKTPKFKLNPKFLRSHLKDFDFLEPPIDPVQLAIDLTETMLFHNGLGLAANQVGLPYRLCVVRADPIIAMYNPRLVDWSDEYTVAEEGCLSFPNLLVKVRRPNVVRVRFTQPNGETVTNKYRGMTARIVCHEISHLNGKLFTDDLAPFLLRRLIERHNKKYKTNYQYSDFRNI